jgi:RHS repeat-associated protein
VLTQTFDGQGRVATQKDARGLSTGQQTSFSYVDNGNGTKTTTVTHPSSAFDASAPQTIDTYDSHGWLTQRIVKPSSTETYTTTYGYDTAGNLISATNARGNTTTFCYDVGVSGSAISGSRGNLTRRIAPAPPGGNPLVTLYAYDAKNNLTQTVSPAGVANGSSVGCATNLSSTVDTMRTTDLAFDATGVFLLSATSRYTDHASTAQTAVTKFEYGDTANPGRVTRIIPPRGNTTSTPDNTYSTTVSYYGSGAQRGLPHTVTDPDGVAWTSAYDAAGRRTDAYDASSNHFAFAYDAEDRLTSYQTPNGSTGAIAGTLHYDAVGNRDYAIDPNGHYTRYAYDERGALAEVRQSTTTTDPDNDAAKIVTKYAYDHLGHLARVTRAEGLGAERATDYVADGLGRLRSEIQYPSWSSTSGSLTTQYTYDANSNRATVVDALSRTTTFGYDALDRLISIDYSAAGTSDVAYTYDANGTRHTMVTGSDTTTYAYDEQNRLTSVTFPGSKTVGYRYDRDGHRSRITYPDGTWVDYSFDKAGRLSGTSDSARDEFGNPIPVTTAYEYWADGSLKKITNANGTTTSFAYDAAHRLTQVVSKDGTTVLDQHDYTLDAVGNRTRLQEVLAPAGGGAPTSVDTTYGYDYLNRLTSATTSGATTVYGYDAVGNRTSAGPSGSPTTYTYDKADRITAAGSTSYTVDANGNLTGRGASNTLTYDQANRLTSIAFGSSNSGAYAYDGDGNRVGRSFATASTTGNVAYVLDVNRGLPTVIDDDARKYVYTLGLAYSVDKTTGAVLTYHADGLGSVRALTDASKAVVQTYRTDAWGTVLATAGSSTQPFSFTGEPTDIESGFVYLRARFYDPAIGRFLSRDPFFGSASSPPSLNRYSYVRNNPTDLIDPSGFEDCDSVGDCQPIGGAVLFSPGLPPQTDGRQPRASRQGDGPAGPPAGPGTTSLRAGAPNVGAEGAEAGQNAAPRGGVYVLRDPATGDVVRTGRAKNLADRERDHRRLGYEFEDVYRTDNYGEQRGLEQYLYDLYPGAVLNKIRAIAEKNTRIADYLNAAADYLAGLP